MPLLTRPNRPCLMGPAAVDAADTRRNASSARMMFGTGTGVDLDIPFTVSWKEVETRLSADEQPEFVALYFPYHALPPWVLETPLPVVALAADWNFLWHAYCEILPWCDLVLTDQIGVEVCRRQGIAQAFPACLYGLGPEFLEHPWPENERDIDVLFVGNLHPAVQRERLAWLGRLAAWGGPRVVIATETRGGAYRHLLGRAKIVFNRSVRGEANKRAFEAACAGALLFQEQDNREVPSFFVPGQEYVAYGTEDLETLLDFYLKHETERRTLAEAARLKVQEYAFDPLWRQGLEAAVPDWEELKARARARPRRAAEALLRARTAALLTSGLAGDPTLLTDLTVAVNRQPNEVALQFALGLITRRVDAFERTVALAPMHALARLGLVETLALAHQKERAVQEGRQLLALLEDGSPLAPGGLGLGGGGEAFDDFRVAWERAAWENVGTPAAEEQAKRGLLRWRLHSLLGESTGGVPHFYEAVLARPDLSSSRRALGDALARTGQPAMAVPHLASAVAANPFDREAARALDQALASAGQAAGRRRLARERRQLHTAAPQVVPPENWFQGAPLVGDERASIVVLCCNEVEYTRQCLESVQEHTRAPYELILVDNGSTDGTPAYLEEVRHWQRPARVAVLRNEMNRGFPAGCNQALAQARGEYLVFLNNDTIVTAGWLNELIACLIGGWPRVGMVGATSNYTRPPQQVPAGYADLAGLPAFAARQRQQFAGRALEVARLTGFCLLARRDVLTQVGGFDEAYGLGFFDDDDLSVKVLQAGYRLAVALGVFIHHFGSRTFARLGVDTAAQLRDNFAKFKERWGPEQVAGYQFPGDRAEATPPIAPPARRPRVSLTMIVKNEEDNLADCLAPVQDLVDEIVIVDTGSTDRTKEIARAYGAKVFDFPWVDSFSAARNEALRHATGDWAFWLDGDDRVDPTNRERLRALFASLGRENRAYVMKCVCVAEAPGASATVVDHVRLFPLRPDVRWRYRVHEQILPSVRAVGGTSVWSDVVIHHVGYTDAALRRRKLDRDLRLLRRELEEQPDDAFTLFNLASVSLELGHVQEALPAIERSLARSHPQDSIVRKLHSLKGQALRQLERPAEALAACVTGRQDYPEDAELLFREALLRREQGQAVEAEACFVRLLNGTEGPHFASVDTGLRGFKARHNLAVLYREQGRDQEAEAMWQHVVGEQPAFVPAWLGLGDLQVRQKHWAQVEAAAVGLEKAGVTGEAALLRARAQLARQEFAAAQNALKALILRDPAALGPRRLLTHVLIQEGRDPVATEAALRAFLALAPEDAEARTNLAIFQRQQVGPPGGRPLASLIILCCNGLEYTRQCLEAVVAHTTPPYELVLVDNGSTDGTPAYLQEIARRLGVDRVMIVRNETNRGFAPGSNQGLLRARGDFLVLLNNDAVVTEGWLDRLIGWALHGGNTPAGLAGPVSNRTDLSQVVPADYAYPGGLAAYAAAQHQEFAGLALARRKLAGFCLLALRRVLEKIGPLDERYELGNLEDFDWCVRARKAGFRPLLAVDLLVHHFGGRTFAALGADLGRSITENLARFRAKWAGDPAAAELFADPPPVEAEGPLLVTTSPMLPVVALAAFEEGVRRLQQGHLVGAEVSFGRALTGSGGGVSAGVVRHNLAAVYLRQGRDAEAEGQLRRALVERPGFVPSLRELGGLAVRRRRLTQVQEWAAALENAGAGPVAAELLRRAAEFDRAAHQPKVLSVP